MRGIESLAVVPLQLGFVQDVVSGTIDFVISGIQDVVPTAVQAVLVLVVGLVVSIYLGKKADGLAVRFGLDDRVQFPGRDGREDAVASAASTTVKYVGITITLLLTIGVLDVQELRNLNQTLLAYAPRLLAAALIAVVGLAVGRAAYRLALNFLHARRFGRSVEGTLVDRAFPAEEGALTNVVSRVVEYYVYLVTLFVVVDVLQVGPLRQLLGAASFYAPSLVAGGAVLVVGVVLAGAVANLVEASETAQRTPAPSVVGEATKAVVVLVAAVVALDVAGVSTQLLVTVLHVVVLPVALGVALAVGLAFGYGGRDIVEQNIEDWL